jgi:hypothetical protein
MQVRQTVQDQESETALRCTTYYLISPAELLFYFLTLWHINTRQHKDALHTALDRSSSMLPPSYEARHP